METAEQREPYESRGSRTDLGAPGGESPPGDSTGRAAPGAKAEWPRRVGLSRSAEVSGPSQTGGQRAFASGLLHVLRSCPCKGSIAVPPDRSARSGRLNFAPVHIDLPTVDVAAHTQK